MFEMPVDNATMAMSVNIGCLSLVSSKWRVRALRPTSSNCGRAGGVRARRGTPGRPRRQRWDGLATNGRRASETIYCGRRPVEQPLL